MQRRDLLAGGVAAILPVPPQAAQAGSPAFAYRWDVPPGGLELRVTDTAVICHCLPPGAAAAPGLPALAAPVAATGPGHTPVRWRISGCGPTDPVTLSLRLEGVAEPLDAEIVLVFDPATGVTRQSTVLRHRGDGEAIELSATISVCLAVDERLDSIVHLQGEWAQETQVRRTQPSTATLRLESRAGKTGFATQPYVAMLTGAATTVCELLWSGNWRLEVLPGDTGAVLQGGLNPWRFRDRLRPGESLVLPSALFGRFEGSLATATQRLHDYRRAHRPDPDRPIPIQFNSWYPYAGEPTADTMLPIIPIAGRLGCEAFVVDAGWYRTDEGDSDADWETRSGDWRVSRRRFPNGLRQVGQTCRDHGMLFGLWFQPEVLGPDSSIRHQHPTWLHHINGAPPDPHKQAVLHLGVPEAWQHVFDRVVRMLRTLSVDWMKWDFNADLDAGGWAPGLPASLTDTDPLVAHYRGLYALQDAIRRDCPRLLLEMCASGGGRLDGEILSHAHVNWISDQPDPLRKLAIHFGTGLAHPAVSCNDWLIAWPPGRIPGYDVGGTASVDRGDLPFRLRVAMLGSFGFSARVDRWPEADIGVAAGHAALYASRLRRIIHHGDQYHLTGAPPPDGRGDWAAIWFVAKDGAEGVLFAFRLAGAAALRSFPLPGLRQGRRYRARPFEGAVDETDGAALAAGLAVTIARRYRSELILVEAIAAPGD